MKIPQAIFLRTYAAMLSFYPAPFRAKYKLQLLDAAQRMHEEHSDHGKLAAALTWDTLKGAWQENMRIPGPKSTFSYLGFAAAFTFLVCFVYGSGQQMWRRGADKAPHQLVTEARNTGVPSMDGAVREISSPEWLDGSDTFVATYDVNGNVQASNGRLHGALPQPPRGIFQEMRQRSEYKVTWQPQRGVRVALVGQPLPQGGYVVAGQSLIPGEARTANLHRLMLEMWALMAVLLLAICVLTRKQRPAS